MDWLIVGSLSRLSHKEQIPRKTTNKTGAATAAIPSHVIHVTASGMASFLLCLRHEDSFNAGEFQMITPTAIPINRRSDRGQRQGLRVIELKSTVVVEINLAGYGMQGSQMNPTIATQLANVRTALQHLEHSLWGCLDEVEEAHRLVDFHHLPRQTRPQITGSTIHNAYQGCDVMRQLRAAAPAAVIDVREIIFQIDAGADGENGL